MLKKQRTPDNLLVEWEEEALKRIREAISRKLYRIIPAILQEKEKRSLQSPLVIYDAWVVWRRNKPTEALRILEESPPVAGPVGKGRKFLAAAIAARTGDINRADAILKSLEGNCIQATKELSVEQMQIHSARIRLSVDIANEISISNQLQPLFKKDPGIRNKLQVILSSQDIMIPALTDWLSDEFVLESQREQPFVPKDITDAQEFRKWLNSKRGELIGRIDPLVEETYISPALREQLQELLKDAEGRDSLVERIIQMVTSGCKKWHLATQGLYLRQAFEVAADKKHPRNTHYSDITIAALRGQKISYQNEDRNYYSIDEYLGAENRGMPSKVLVSGKTLDLIKQLVGMNFLSGVLGDNLLEMLDFSQGIEETVVESNLYGLLMNTFEENTKTVLLYLLSTDPLDVLYKTSLQIPIDTKSPKF